MPRGVNKRTLRFVRALVAGGNARRDDDGLFRMEHAGRQFSLPAAQVQALASDGVLDVQGTRCQAASQSLAWCRRALATTDEFASQHQIRKTSATGVCVNLAESPLARLALARGRQPPFLARHQIEAGERVRRTVERARLSPRITLSYDPLRVAGRASGSGDLTDMVIEARRGLEELVQILPADCANVVLDVCGLLKGLQTVEMEREWPRRSAKLVLRIGLEQLAQHYGLAPATVGPNSRRPSSWRGDGARPEVWG